MGDVGGDDGSIVDVGLKAPVDPRLVDELEEW